MIIVCAGVDVFAKAEYDAAGLGIAVFIATASGDGRKLFVDKAGIRPNKGLRLIVGEGQVRFGSWGGAMMASKTARSSVLSPW